MSPPQRAVGGGAQGEGVGAKEEKNRGRWACWKHAILITPY